MKLKKYISTFNHRILQTIKLFTIPETMIDYEYYKLHRRTKRKIISITIKHNKIKTCNNFENEN